MEKRAIRVSHQLWKQFVTEGYTSGGIKCIKGLPEDARFVTAFLRESLSEKDGDRWIMRPDPVFIFVSDQWAHPARNHTIKLGGEEYPAYDPVFQIAECRTCKWWTRHGDDLQEMGACTAPTAFVDVCTGKGLTLTSKDFGCTSYELRETDD